MAVLTLPVRTDEHPHYEFRTQLEGRTYAFELRWNSRAPAWYLTIKTADGEVLVATKLVVGIPLTARASDRRLFPGELIAVDTSGGQKNPARGDLGNRVQVLYYEAADLAAVAGG